MISAAQFLAVDAQIQWLDAFARRVLAAGTGTGGTLLHQLRNPPSVSGEIEGQFNIRHCRRRCRLNAGVFDLYGQLSQQTRYAATAAAAAAAAARDLSLHGIRDRWARIYGAGFGRQIAGEPAE